MSAAPLDYDALRSDYAVFFQLLGNERGIRLRLNLPDTLVIQRGQPVAWFATSKEGYVVQRPVGRSSWEDVRVHLLSCALDDSGRYQPFVAVMRGPDGTPKLLSRAALDALCERLDAAAAVAGEGGTGSTADGAPCLLQAYVPPFLDLRYVTSYTNDGASISCHTFQRRFSRRYLQYRDPAAIQVLPGVLTGSPGPEPGVGPGAPLANNADAADVGADVGADLGADVSLLDDAALADSERSLARTLGPVDPSLKMAARKAAHGLVQYVQKAHLLTLRGLVCEFARDPQGHLWFLGPLRADWASLIPGRGGEPWANANLTQQPRDEGSWPSTADDEVDLQGSLEQPVQAQPLPQHKRQMQQPRPVRGSGAAPAAGGSPAKTGEQAAAVGITESLLPPTAIHGPEAQQQAQQEQPEQQEPGSPGIPALAAGSPGSPPGKPAGCLDAAGLHSPQQALPAKVALRRSPGQPKERPFISTAGSGGTAGGWQHGSPHAHASSPNATASTRGGCHVSSPTQRGSLLSSHLTKELETVRDELLVQTDLADALAYKVEALEHDKHVITAAFEQVVGNMQGDLREVKERLEALRVERDGLSCTLAETQQRLASAEAERDQLRSVLNAERDTAFTSLGQFQKQQEDAGVRAIRAEAELRSLQERYQEEQAANDALKKMMVFYQHASGDSGAFAADLGAAGRSVIRSMERPELKYAETLQDVDELLMREMDPTGERYALSKVLHTCQGDLHAIFLHYCMLDSGFARFWPPHLSLASWLAFMKDIGSTNLVPGTRTRSDNTMHVQEATEVFRRYCLRQAVMRGGASLSIRAPSSMRLDAYAAAGAASSVKDTPAGDAALPPRPASGQSTASAALTARPFSASSAQLASATMSYQSFCAALVHVGAKVARSSPELMEACPFLSEQTRAFIEQIIPKAQRVTPIAQAGKKGAAAAAMGGGGKGSPASGSLGAKDAAAKEAASKLPKLKKAKAVLASASASPGVGGSGASGSHVLMGADPEMSAIAEASREGSASLRTTSA